MNERCGWCSSETSKVYHTGYCPQVKAIEYYPDGSVKRVEFHSHQSTITMDPRVPFTIGNDLSILPNT